MAMESTRPCAVVACRNDGHPQVCPFDGRYHHHGRIHYANDLGLPMTFQAIGSGEWRFICNEHYAQIVAALDASRVPA